MISRAHPELCMRRSSPHQHTDYSEKESNIQIQPRSQTDHWVVDMWDGSESSVKALKTEQTSKPQLTGNGLKLAA